MFLSIVFFFECPDIWRSHDGSVFGGIFTKLPRRTLPAFSQILENTWHYKVGYVVIMTRCPSCCLKHGRTNLRHIIWWHLICLSPCGSANDWSYISKSDRIYDDIFETFCSTYAHKNGNLRLRNVTNQERHLMNVNSLNFAWRIRGLISWIGKDDGTWIKFVSGYDVRSCHVL